MPTSKDAPKEETAVFESKIETKQNCIVTNNMQLYLVHEWNQQLTIWWYGLSSFQAGGTKFERFLPTNQHNQGNYWILRIGVMWKCQKLS